MSRVWNILEVVVAGALLVVVLGLIAHFGFGIDLNGTGAPVETGQVVPKDRVK